MPPGGSGSPITGGGFGGGFVGPPSPFTIGPPSRPGPTSYPRLSDLPDWVKDLGTVIYEGAGTGLAKRAEAQLMGTKAAVFGATGASPTSMTISNQSSAQQASQGQQIAANEGLAMQQRAYQSHERVLDRQHEVNLANIYTRNGDTTGGQISELPRSAYAPQRRTTDTYQRGRDRLQRFFGWPWIK